MKVHKQRKSKRWCSYGIDAIGAKQRNIDCLKLLLKHGASVNVTDVNGATALHKAVGTASISFDSENVEVVQFLISNGADCSLKDRLGSFYKK